MRVRHKSLETQYQQQTQDLEAQVVSLKARNEAAEKRLLEFTRSLAQNSSVDITDTPLPLKMLIPPNPLPTSTPELSSSAKLGSLEVATLVLLGNLANEGASEADIERMFSGTPEGTTRLQLTVALENLMQANLVARAGSRYALTSTGQRAALKSLAPG